MKSIEQQRKIIDAATPGPWTTELVSGDTTGDPNSFTYGMSPSVVIAATAAGKSNRVYATPKGGTHPAADQRFIAESRNQYPALLDWAERAREMLKLFLDDRLLKSIIEQLLTELPKGEE